jgi:hypothetical protein
LLELKMNRLTNLEEVEDARRRLTSLLDARGVWLLRERRDGAAVELRRGAWEMRVASGALVLSYRGDAGARTWRVTAWRVEDESLSLEAVRRMGAERALLCLVPRALVASARDAVADARRAECRRIAALVCRFAGAEPEQVRLSAGARRGEPGRWARIRVRRGRESFAVAGPVVAAGAEDAESFLSSALLWLARLEGGAPAARPRGLWLIAPPKLAAAVCERLPLLREDLRALISVFETDSVFEPDTIHLSDSAFESDSADELTDKPRGPSTDNLRNPSTDNLRGLSTNELHRLSIDEPRGLSTDEPGGLMQVHAPALSELLDAPAPRLSRPATMTCELIDSVVALAPGEIDFVRARRGETLRFLGLPFARVRRVKASDRLWFGIEASRHRALLDEESAPGFLKLVAELKEHRRADAPNRQHALYRAAPEAWLEALLRRDVQRLDPGLRLAPLHAQFRTPHAGGGARPVDLLALRHDGRLAVVELKVSEDAALALQGADYWRRVEAHRRRGDIARARLFGDAHIAAEPPLVYLVAPMLRFHGSFATLARAVRPEIEMYRFDINEDWRAGVRVVRIVTLTNNWQ